jgi:hypothetical protein
MLVTVVVDIILPFVEIPLAMVNFKKLKAIKALSFLFIFNIIFIEIEQKENSYDI